MSESRQSIHERIVRVVSEVFGVAPSVVGLGVSPEKVKGWDSEKHVVLVMALEEEFGCMFEAEDIPELVSLERIEEIIKRHGAGSQ
jgi:acyl carrier protein